MSNIHNVQYTQAYYWLWCFRFQINKYYPVVFPITLFLSPQFVNSISLVLLPFHLMFLCLPYILTSKESYTFYDGASTLTKTGNHLQYLSES